MEFGILLKNTYLMFSNTPLQLLVFLSPADSRLKAEDSLFKLAINLASLSADCNPKTGSTRTNVAPDSSKCKQTTLTVCSSSSQTASRKPKTCACVWPGTLSRCCSCRNCSCAQTMRSQQPDALTSTFRLRSAVCRRGTRSLSRCLLSHWLQRRRSWENWSSQFTRTSDWQVCYQRFSAAQDVLTQLFVRLL